MVGCCWRVAGADEVEDRLLKRRPGAAEGSSAQSLKRPSMPREARRLG